MSLLCRTPALFLALLLGLLLLEHSAPCAAQPLPVRSGWEWMKQDAYDEFMDEFNTIAAHNCRPKRGLTMNANTVSQLPKFNTMLEVRTALRACSLSHASQLQVIPCLLKYEYIQRNIQKFDNLQKLHNKVKTATNEQCNMIISYDKAYFDAASLALHCWSYDWLRLYEWINLEL